MNSCSSSRITLRWPPAAAILEGEGDFVFVDREKSRIGDGGAMRIAGEIGEDLGQYPNGGYGAERLGYCSSSASYRRGLQHMTTFPKFCTRVADSIILRALGAPSRRNADERTYETDVCAHHSGTQIADGAARIVWPRSGACFLPN